MIREPAIPPAVAEHLGRPRLVRRLTSSPRSVVHLVEFDGSPAVVKRITGGPDAAERFRVEVTALRLAGQVRPRPVAALLAADPDTRTMVLEHLAGVRPAGRPWAVEYATALARLHSTPPVAGIPAYRDARPEDADRFLGLARTLGVDVPPGARPELEAVCAGLAHEDDHVLLHGDPCPDNAVVTAGGIRFVDLEGAHRGPPAAELAYLRIGFPTCWCVRSLPAAHVAAAERAYRAARPAGDLADACIGWLVQGDALVERARRRGADHLARLKRHDWEWGPATARQRLLHRLRVVAALTRDDPGRPAVAALTAAMAAAVEQRWPEVTPIPATDDSPLHPAGEGDEGVTPPT
jgi:hypothetical protein